MNIDLCKRFIKAYKLNKDIIKPIFGSILILVIFGTCVGLMYLGNGDDFIKGFILGILIVFGLIILGMLASFIKYLFE